MEPTTEHRKKFGATKWKRITLLIVLGYEAVGCIIGGTFLIATPDGRMMDMPIDLMNGVFRDFLVPGIILFGLGILNTIAFFAVIRRTHSDWFWAYFSLGGLLIWFWVEISILHRFHWLHAMWGLPVIAGGLAAIQIIPSKYASLSKAMFICGILSSFFYLALNIFVPMQWSAYNSASQTVSELSAVNAPTRQLWVWLSTLYTVLVVAFSWGVWKSAQGNSRLRIAGCFMIAYGIVNVFWPLAPMHLREVLAAGGSSISDTMHLVFAGTTVMLMLLGIGFGAAAFGKTFRLYSIITILMLAVFGFLTSLDAPRVQANLSTPLAGVWERINIGVFLLWVVVLAITLLRKEGVQTANDK